jgi:2',3'-cyclic-nucleotide 2'-phosphodiesterase (5'-nucleotidase family)
VLDAGDRFTGTLWFNKYQGQAAAKFVNMENYDAVVCFLIMLPFIYFGE